MTDTDHLPAAADEGAGRAVELSSRTLPRRFTDTARSLAVALPAVDFLNEADPGEDEETDSELVLLPGMLAVGLTPGAALRRAAAFLDAASHLDINSFSLAKMPGTDEEGWEWHATVVFASIDASTGESGGSTHHGSTQHSYPAPKGGGRRAPSAG